MRNPQTPEQLAPTPARRPYTPPRVEKKRSVQRVTLVSGTESLVSTPTSPPPAA